MKKKLYVCISLDVEEEGLFSGKYSSRNVSVDNVALLPRLAPLSREFGLPLTLFCAYPVFANGKARDTLAWMRDNCGAEIGAHLHHWSTPPYAETLDQRPERAHKMPRGLLAARLDTLLKAGADFQGAPLTSFRMGRWDLKAPLLALLAERGIRVDSSICPLRAFADGPNHFLAPADPYWHDTACGKRILEMPITQLPFSRYLAKSWHALACRSSLLDSFHFFGALSANPIWHSAKIMRFAANLHTRRGGQVLSLFWHSSEMFPGGSPHIPDQKSAAEFLRKIFSFCAWLNETYDIQGVTATGFAGIATELPLPLYQYALSRDW